MIITNSVDSLINISLLYMMIAFVCPRKLCGLENYNNVKCLVIFNSLSNSLKPPSVQQTSMWNVVGNLPTN